MAWWHSIDRERWEGPFETREAAIEKGADSYYLAPDLTPGESFYVCEAEQESYTVLDIDADDVLARVADRYEDLSDPDGNGLFSGAISNEQLQELSRELTAVLQQWIVRHNIKTGIFTFKGSAENEELIKAGNHEST